MDDAGMNRKLFCTDKDVFPQFSDETEIIIEYNVYPGEKQTYDCPESADEIDIVSLYVDGSFVIGHLLRALFTELQMSILYDFVGARVLCGSV